MLRSMLKTIANRQRLLMAWCVFLLAAPLFGQETVDPALELYYSANAVYNRKQYPLAIPIVLLFKRWLQQGLDAIRAELVAYQEP